MTRKSNYLPDLAAYCRQFVMRARKNVSNDKCRVRDIGPMSAADAGLTLVELLVVLAILGLFAALAAPQVLKYLGTAKTGTAKTQLSNLQSAIELYYLDIGAYPQAGQGLQVLITAPPQLARWNGPYLTRKKALNDPWGRAYRYRFPGKHGDFDIYSYGRDGQEGGTGEDADITSW